MKILTHIQEVSCCFSAKESIGLVIMARFREDGRQRPLSIPTRPYPSLSVHIRPYPSLSVHFRPSHPSLSLFVPILPICIRPVPIRPYPSVSVPIRPVPIRPIANCP